MIDEEFVSPLFELPPCLGNHGLGLAGHILAGGPAQEPVHVENADLGHVSRVISQQDLHPDIGRERRVEFAQPREMDAFGGGIHDEFGQATGQSCLNRFLTDAPWDVEALNLRRLDLLQKDPSTRYSDQGEIPIDGHKAVGHDVEFFALDLINACQIRCFRPPHRTVMIFGQWSEAEGDEPELTLRAIRQSMEEVDGG